MIPKFSVKKPYTVAVSVIMVFILGFVSFMNMTTDLLPSIDLPIVMVNTAYPGANPEKVEAYVTKPLEQVLSTTSGVENISSVSSENSSLVMLEFNQSINMDSAMIDMSSKIDMVKGQFEDGVGSPMIIKMNPDMMPIMMLSIDIKGMDIKEVTKYVNEKVMPEFERIEGVASVDAIGLVEEKLKVMLNEEKIDEINNKILDSIDSGLATQQTELNKAKNEINKSKEVFDKQSNEQRENLNNAGSELKNAKKQLQDAVNAIGIPKEELVASIDSANSMIDKNNDQIDTLKSMLDKLPPSATAEIETINGQISALESATQEISQGVDSAKKGVEAYDALRDLENKEKELESGKTTLESELSKASKQLSDGESKLNEAQKQLDEGKEQAYKAANIKDKITTEMIGNILMAENFSMPAGYITENETQYSIKVGDKFSSIEELKNLLLFNVEGVGEIRIQDVANVELTNNSDETYANINGNEGIMLSFQKASTYSTSNVTKSINKTIEKLKIENKDMHITTLMDQGVYIDMIVDSVLDNLVYGGLLAIIVLLIFLKSFKTTIVIAFSIPISVLFSLVLMYFSGITLNIISLSGLALGVGMLVDNSIVVIENIYRLQNQGMSRAKAAVYGARQVSAAIFASTLTTICVFLPIVFTEGITRQLFTDMGLTIAYSLIASLIVALTVVPAMSSSLLTNVDKKEHRLFDRFVDIYEVILRKSLQHKWIVLLFAIVLLVFSGYKTISMGTTFMPSMDSTQMSATMTVPKGTKRSDALYMSDEFVDRVMSIEDVETVGAMESSGPSMFGGSNGGMSFYIILKEDKKLTNLEIEKIIYDKTKDINAEIDIVSSNMDMSALGGSGIQIIVKGNDLDTLYEISQGISKILEETEGTMDISDGFEEVSSETRVVVDKNKAMEYGLTVAQVYQMVSNALETEKESTTVTLENNDYPVVIGKNADITRDNLSEYIIKANKDGEEVEIKLGDIASIKKAEGLNSISRDNQVRYITVSAGIDSKHNIGLVSRDINSELKEYKLPEGYTIEMGGENETINKSLRDMVLMGVLAITFIYLIMVAQFQSLLSPFIVMFTIPLAFTGGLLALLITGNEISVISMLGFLVLSGVVVNNGIVFVDYINQLRLEGLSKKDAIIETGRARIRPILMTALTTILAMSTMAVGVGMGSEMTQGLAIVTIGGLTYATILTLVVVPVLYDLFHRKKMKQIRLEED